MAIEKISDTMVEILEHLSFRLAPLLELPPRQLICPHPINRLGRKQGSDLVLLPEKPRKQFSNRLFRNFIYRISLIGRLFEIE